MTKRRRWIIYRNNLLLILHLTQIIPHIIFSPFTSWISHMDAGSRLSWLSIAQGAEWVETQAPFPRKSIGKHKPALTALYISTVLLLTQGKTSHLDLIFARVWKTKPHLQEALKALRALTASPRHSAPRWHIPAASCQQAPNLRTTAGTRAKEQPSLPVPFTRHSLFFSAASCKGERTTPALLQVAGKIHKSTPKQSGSI